MALGLIFDGGGLYRDDWVLGFDGKGLIVVKRCCGLFGCGGSGCLTLKWGLGYVGVGDGFSCSGGDLEAGGMQVTVKSRGRDMFLELFQ